MFPSFALGSSSISKVIVSSSPTLIVAFNSFILIWEANLYILKLPVPSWTVVFVPLISLNIAFTSYLPAANRSNSSSALLIVSPGVIVAFCFTTTPEAFVIMNVISPSCLPAI